ncbi:hypothetical protein glysoja_018699, partial [Glycine soja]
MKSLAVAWFMVFMISSEHGINVQGSTRLSILRISQGIQPSQYVTITEFAYFLNPYKVDKLMFLQDATMTATQHVVTVTSLNSLHFVFYAVRKIL